MLYVWRMFDLFRLGWLILSTSLHLSLSLSLALLLLCHFRSFPSLLLFLVNNTFSEFPHRGFVSAFFICRAVTPPTS